MRVLPNTSARAVKRLCRKFGLDLRRYSPVNDEFLRLTHYLQLYKVSLVLDVGANVGQFAQGLRAAGFAGRIISFEPLRQAHAVLACKADARWIVAPRAAIGDRRAQVEINVSGNSYSSSLLPILERHIGAAPSSAYVATETVTMMPLDEAAREFIEPRDVVFVKIDVQGLEAQVLTGAEATLEKTAGLELELSLLPLYEGSASWECLVAKILAQGFQWWDVKCGFRDPRDYRLLQLDGIFFRDRVLNSSN